MAYDPEAREQSNSAMIIAVVALVIVVLGALAWFATKPGETPVVESQTRVEKHTETVTEVPVDNTPNTVVVQPNNPAPAPGTRTETHVTVEQPANPAPANGGAATPASPPAGSPPATPPAGDGASGTSSSPPASGY